MHMYIWPTSGVLMRIRTSLNNMYSVAELHVLYTVYCVRYSYMLKQHVSLHTELCIEQRETQRATEPG